MYSNRGWLIGEFFIVVAGLWTSCLGHLQGVSGGPLGCLRGVPMGLSGLSWVGNVLGTRLGAPCEAKVVEHIVDFGFGGSRGTPQERPGAPGNSGKLGAGAFQTPTIL